MSNCPKESEVPLKHLTLQHLRAHLLRALALSCMFALTACGGGGAGGVADPVDPGRGPVESPAPPPAAEPHWSANPVRIDDPAAVGDSRNPAVVADAAGNATAAWTQVHNGRIGIHSSIYKAATASWSEPFALDDPDAGNSGRPVLAVDGGGNVIAMWSQANGPATSTIYARRYDAAQGRWGASEQVRTAERAELPVLVVDGAGSATAAWVELASDSGLQSVLSSRFHQGSWSAPVPLSGADTFGVLFEPALAADGSGQVVAAWSEEPVTGSSFIIIKASRFDGTAWSAPARVDDPAPTPTGSYSYRPALAADSLGGFTLAWIQDDLAGISIFSSRFDGDAWSAPTRISTESATVGDVVRLATDSAGNVGALWDEFTPDNVHHVSSNRFRAGEWGIPVQIASGEVAEATTFALAAQANGDLVAVWTAFNARSTIASSRYVAASNRWGPPQQIDAPGAVGDATSPAITLDPAGKATAAWVQLQGGRAVIHSNRFE